MLDDQKVFSTPCPLTIVVSIHIFPSITLQKQFFFSKVKKYIWQGDYFTWKNLEFRTKIMEKPGITWNLTIEAKKTWNLRNFENNLEKPGILYKSHRKNLEFCTKVMVKPGSFFNLNVLTILM